MDNSDTQKLTSLEVNNGKGIQLGDNNQQTNIFYGDDPEEEKVATNIETTSPYLGLQSFNTCDSKRFYGRKRLIDDLLKDLNKDNLNFLIGASGSGKSSLVQAGLIPKLSTQNKNFVSLTLVPNENPFYSFYAQILALINQYPKDYKQSDAQIAIPPHDNDNDNALEYLVKVVQEIKKKPESLWLIFIDQLEEILTITQRENSHLFIDSLSYLIKYLRDSKNNSVKIILAMRTDFLDQFMNKFPDFVITIQTGERKPFTYITPMTDQELKLVIKNPAATHGVNVERDLVEEIINDFRGGSRSLPLLQYTLDLLWQKDNLSDRLLNKKTYEDLGRVGGALQEQAETIYENYFDQRLGKEVEKIFRQLVTITSDGKKVSKREDRSVFINQGLKTIVTELIQEHRLLISGRQKDSVEIAHEAIINSWSRLHTWIDEYEEEIILRRQLNDSAQTWQKFKTNDNKDKATDELWSGSKLERVLELRDKDFFGILDENSNQFLEASIDKRNTEQEKERKLLLDMLGELTVENMLSRNDHAGEIKVLDSAVWKTLSQKEEKIFSALRDYGKGKIFAGAHDGILKGKEENRIFLRIAFGFLSLSSDTKKVLISSGHCETVSLKEALYMTPTESDSLKKQFESLGYSAENISAPIDKTKLNKGNILVVGNAWGNFMQSEIDAIEDFVKNGGNLFLTGLGWSWKAYSQKHHKERYPQKLAGQNTQDMSTFPMNRLVEPYKMHWTDSTIQR